MSAYLYRLGQGAYWRRRIALGSRCSPVPGWRALSFAVLRDPDAVEVSIKHTDKARRVAPR
ncbi:MAG: hypothetical protein ABW135_01265 [Thermoleophilaceae bacterium]